MGGERGVDSHFCDDGNLPRAINHWEFLPRAKAGPFVFGIGCCSIRFPSNRRPNRIAFEICVFWYLPTKTGQAHRGPPEFPCSTRVTSLRPLETLSAQTEPRGSRT